MSNKIAIGFWSTFTSWSFSVLLEVLQLNNIVLSPVLLNIASCVLVLLTLFGLSMMGYGIIQWARQSRKQKQIIEKQNDNITDLEHSLESLRREYSGLYLVNLPSLLTWIHRHLQSVVGVMSGLKTDDEVLLGVIQSWTAKIGVKIWYYPKKGKVNRLLMGLQISMLLFRLKKKLSLTNDAMIVSLHKLAGELDDKGIGIASNLDDSYSAKREELDNLLQGLGSEDVSNAIQKLLLYSYGLNSLLLFVQYVRVADYPRWIPMKFRTSESSLTQAINIQIASLRANAVNQLQLYLVGRKRQ